MKLPFTALLAIVVLCLNGCSSSTSPDNSGNSGNGGSGTVKYVFAGTEHGLYRSTDLGKSWLKTTGPSYYPGAVLNDKGKYLATIGLSGLFTSTDSGVSWTLDSTLNYFNGGLASFNGLLLAGTGAGLAASSDDGATWQVEDQNTIPLTFATADGFIFGGAFRGILRSKDGRTWQQVSSLDAESITAKGSDLYAAVMNGGVYHSADDGSTWQQMNTGLPYPYVRAIAVSGSTLFLGTDDGFYSRDIAGDTWTRVELPGAPKYAEVRSVSASGAVVAVGSPNSGIFLSSDAGKTWTRSTPNVNDTAVWFVSLQ